jgi:hypothetical protein
MAPADGGPVGRGAHQMIFAERAMTLALRSVQIMPESA